MKFKQALIFASNNKHKLEEVSAILGAAVELSTPHDHGIVEDIPETQSTLEGNALQKARYVYDRVTGGNRAVAVGVFADDTGLEVASLGGAPGVRSARYAADAGEGSLPSGEGTFGDNNRLLLRNLDGIKDRSARFRTVIALIVRRDDGTPEEHLFEGRVEGRIIDEYRGGGGFGYDPVFVPDGSTETFAEMPLERKNRISHRARAVEKFAEFIKNHYRK